MPNGSTNPHGAVTVKGAVPIVAFDFKHPEIKDMLDGAMSEVPQPNECTSDAWCKFGAELAFAMGERGLSNVFVGMFPWTNMYRTLMLMPGGKRMQFLHWFFALAFPEIGLYLGETLAHWMTRGVLPTSAEMDKSKAADRLRSVASHISKYGLLIPQIVHIDVPGGVLLRGDVKPTPTWGDAMFIHEQAEWTEANQAVIELLKPLRGTWEYAWTVVRALVELIVVDEIKMHGNQLTEWAFRRVTVSPEEGMTRYQDRLRAAYKEGVQVGRVTGTMQEYLRWACHGHLGTAMASAIRDRTLYPQSLGDPARYILAVWQEGYWPIGRVGYSYYVHDLFPAR